MLKFEGEILEKVGSIRQGYLAKCNEYPEDEKKIFVMRGCGNDELAPSEELLSDYKELEEKCGDRWKAWNRCRYEERFKEKMKCEKSRKRIEEIARDVANGKKVRLICYQKNPPCHRFILKKLIGEKVTRMLVAPIKAGEESMTDKGGEKHKGSRTQKSPDTTDEAG